jgi:hypothetical protein
VLRFLTLIFSGEKKMITSIPTSLSELVSLAESANNKQAIRYEQYFKPSIAAITNCKKHNGNTLSFSTANMLCKTSFGLFQIMGENIYGPLKYQKSIFDFVQSETDQLELFNRFIKWRGIDNTLEEILHDSEKRKRFSRRYNGDGITYSKYLIDVFTGAGGVI